VVGFLHLNMKNKETWKAIIGFTILGIGFLWLYFYSGNPLALLFSHTPLRDPLSSTVQAPSGHAVPLQEVKNLGYDFYIGQIDDPKTNDLTDDLKNQITKIVYDAHFPEKMLQNMPIIVLNSLYVTGDQYIPIAGKNLQVGSLTGAFLSEGGYYSTYQDGATAIFINKTTLTQNDLTETLTHELGHAIGSTLTAKDWIKYYQLRGIPSGTAQEISSWNLSPAEDWAEVFKYTFTGIGIRTYYGLLVPSYQDMESISCESIHINLYSNYSPKVDTTDPMYILHWNAPTGDQAKAIEAKVSADPQMQACRRKAMSDSSQWTLGVPYKYTVSQATEDFINSIVTRVNEKEQ
jgi:hypothetical protein